MRILVFVHIDMLTFTSSQNSPLLLSLLRNIVWVRIGNVDDFSAVYCSC